MVTRLRKSIENKDKGFTLIELLVVIVIIGILAAIAIPIFLNQRKKAADAGVKSDVRQVATQLESAFTDNNSYPVLAALPTTAGASYTINNELVKLSPNDTIADVKYNAATASGATGFCVRVVSTAGTNTTGYVWDSLAGGLQPSTVTACPAVYTTSAVAIAP